MVFTAFGCTTSTTGYPYPAPPAKEPEHVESVDRPVSATKHEAADKHDVWSYTLYNAPLIGLAGLVTGAQEAYYKFEKMPPAASRQTFRQAWSLYSIIAKKFSVATALGAVFCFTEAMLEDSRGKHDMFNGMVAGAVAGAAFALLPPKPMPQPIAWPLAFAAAAMTADIIGEKLPHLNRNFRYYGPVFGRENWNDPAPPRPPILDTGASARPIAPGHFWRGH